MEAGELIRKQVRVIEIYLNYWHTNIKPLENEHRVVQFEHIISEVVLELYGPRVAFELAVRFLVEDEENLAAVKDC